LNRETNDKKEEQSPIKWEIRKVMSAEGVPVSIYCAETHTLQLEKFDDVCKRLSLNSTICQLEYQLKIKVRFYISYRSIEKLSKLGQKSKIRRRSCINFTTIWNLFSCSILSKICCTNISL